MKASDLDAIRPLLMGLMDGELTPEEAVRVNDALMRSAALREEFELLRESSGRLEALSLLEAPDAVVRRIWRSPYHRLARNAGLWLVIGGYVALVGYALYCLAAEDGPIVPRLGVFAIVLGTAILLFTFVRERIESHRDDPYKEIER